MTLAKATTAFARHRTRALVAAASLAIHVALLLPLALAEPDRARQEGFDRQARANEAWREYTRGEGAYPGLRSLLRDR